MKEKVVNLSSKLKDVHKRFLEKERLQAEDHFQRKIAPFEFLLMLTQDKNFAWMQPFSAMIAEIDAFVSEAKEISQNDLICIRDQIDFIFKDTQSTLGARYQHHLNNDADFIMLHSSLKKVLNEYIGKV
ncbi:MAG: hypothetical protein H7177_11930 [Rhizobacter sp.]|nr:hypothetical protein [Bacteriovorax sp.]